MIKYKYIDSHVHLTHRKYDGQVPCIVGDGANDELIQSLSRTELISLMKTQVKYVVEPGIDLASCSAILELAKNEPEFVLPAIGIHPTRSPKTPWADRKKVEELAKTKGVIAIGELGLDYHYPRRSQHRFRQKRWFKWQLELAHRLKLPLVLHIRMAEKDAIKILKRYHKAGKLHGGVCHCFAYGPELAKVFTEELGLMIGIGGTLLQSQMPVLKETVKEIPLKYILLETDGPYVKGDRPEQVSGKKWRNARNTSLIIPQVAEEIGKIKGVSAEEVVRICNENAEKLFIKVKKMENIFSYK